MLKRMNNSSIEPKLNPFPLRKKGNERTRRRLDDIRAQFPWGFRLVRVPSGD